MENKLLFQGFKAVPRASTSTALRCHPCGVDWEGGEGMQSLGDFMEAATGILMPSG